MLEILLFFVFVLVCFVNIRCMIWALLYVCYPSIRKMKK